MYIYIYIFVHVWDAARRAARVLVESVEEDAPKDGSGKTRALWQLYAKLRDLTLASDPGSASMLGDQRWSHRLADLSREAFDAQRAALEALQAELAAVLPSADALPTSEWNNHGFLVEMIALSLKRLESWQCYETPTNQLFGPHLEFVPICLQFSPQATPAERRDLLARMGGFASQVDQIIAAFRAGVAVRRTHPPSAIAAIAAQCGAQLGPFDASPLAPLAKAADGDVDEASFGGAVRRLVTRSIQPAYGRLKAFLEDEYAPHARATAGISGWEGGAAMYGAAVAYFTSLPTLTAAEVHEMGLAEVARIRAAMSALQKASGAKMLSSPPSHTPSFVANLPLRSFMDALKADPAQAPADGAEIVREYQKILEVAERVARHGVGGGAPAPFGLLPVAGYEVKPVEPFREAHAPPAFYYPPAADGTRGGVFYANTYKPETRGKFTMESIALHEAIPGQ